MPIPLSATHPQAKAAGAAATHAELPTAGPFARLAADAAAAGSSGEQAATGAQQQAPAAAGAGDGAGPRGSSAEPSAIATHHLNFFYPGIGEAVWQARGLPCLPLLYAAASKSHHLPAFACGSGCKCEASFCCIARCRWQACPWRPSGGSGHDDRPAPGGTVPAGGAQRRWQDDIAQGEGFKCCCCVMGWVPQSGATEEGAERRH